MADNEISKNIHYQARIRVIGDDSQFCDGREDGCPYFQDMGYSDTADCRLWLTTEGRPRKIRGKMLMLPKKDRAVWVWPRLKRCLDKIPFKLDILKEQERKKK